MLASATLPASGSGTNYLVWGTVEIEGQPIEGAALTDATCSMTLGGASSDSDTVEFTVPSTGAQIENVSMAFSATISSAAQVFMDCSTLPDSTATVTANVAYISAIQYTSGVGT